MNLKDFKINLDQIAVLVVIITAMLFYNVVFNSPIIFGDEGHYAAMARDIIRTMTIPERLTFVSDATFPPITSKAFFYIFTASGWLLMGEIGLKLLLPIPSILTALMIYLLLKKFENKKAGIAAAFIFLMIPSLITYGVMTYTDTLLCFLIISSVYFALTALETKNKLHIIVSGIFAGLAILSKITGPVIILFLLAYLVLIKKFKQWKIIFAIIVIALLVITPWYFIRNPILFGSICYQEISEGPNCKVRTVVETPLDIDAYYVTYAAKNPGGGTEAGLVQFGLLNYSRFAFGWAVSILFLFGMCLSFIRKNKIDKILLILLIVILPLLYFSGNRAEDTARYLLPITLPIALISGIFVSNVFDRLKKYHIAIALIFILIFSYSTWIYGQEKLNTMMQVKQFIPGVFDACDWMKENTPEDSTFIATYGQQVSYQCNRKVTFADNLPVVYLANNDTSYEVLKLDKVDYVYIIEGLITQEAYMENYPLAFVQYLESSDKFELAYDNRNRFGAAGVRIYEVL